METTYTLSTAEGQIFLNARNAAVPPLFFQTVKNCFRTAVGKKHPRAFRAPGITFATEKEILSGILNLFSEPVRIPQAPFDYKSFRADCAELENLAKQKKESGLLKRLCLSWKIWNIERHEYSLPVLLSGFAAETDNKIWQSLCADIAEEIKKDIVIRGDEEI